MPDVGYLMPLGFLAAGAFFVAVGLRLLAEHRDSLILDRVSLKSFELFARLFRLGGSGYFAALTLVVGIALVFAGVLVLLLQRADMSAAEAMKLLRISLIVVGVCYGVLLAVTFTRELVDSWNGEGQSEFRVRALLYIVLILLILGLEFWPA